MDDIKFSIEDAYDIIEHKLDEYIECRYFEDEPIAHGTNFPAVNNNTLCRHAEGNAFLTSVVKN